MKFMLKKLLTVGLISAFAGLFLAPSALAVNCDKDGDGYIVIPPVTMELIAPDVNYNPNGDYAPVQWQDFYEFYTTAELTDDEKCNGMNFKKGAEPQRCDNPVIGASSNVYDPSKVTTPLRGNQVYPGALDVADNGIDEDCDGKDATLLAEGGGKDLGGLVDKVINLLSRAVVVVSIVIMIWGGVLYATAAGDEAKTAKARKAIIGAVIGLIVGLLAPTVIEWVAANLV